MNTAHPSESSIAHMPAVAATQRPELLAPAGNWECAKAAVENGADAIYFGLEQFNARMRAENFTLADLPELMASLHRRGVKGYVTLNTLVFTHELAQAEQYLRAVIAAGVDAAIVQDIGICRLIRHLSADFPIHASTQMTVTSAAGVEFAQALGCQLVVLARESSLKEIHKIQQQLGDRNRSLPLEVFVHGALCVAYSGQCLTSEALGGRSANRGECAQACRMPYDLIANGQTINLGDRAYLLSPQDLAGLDVLSDLIQTGVTCLKIEGRLKSAEYVANVTRVYREALDRIRVTMTEHGSEEGVIVPPSNAVSVQERYSLEMAFSRGLHTGWFEGINNQELVHARFGKKRGFYLGEVIQIDNEQVTIFLSGSNQSDTQSLNAKRQQYFIKPGDGVVFDSGHPEAPEEGGRIYAVQVWGEQAVLTFGRRDVDLRRVHVGDRVWKTSDPELDRQVRQSYAGEMPKFQRSIQLDVHGEVGQPLVAIATDQQGHVVQVESTMSLVAAHSKPLTTDRLQEQFGRLGNTPFCLGKLTNHLKGAVLLPVSELNQLRRAIVSQLERLRAQPKRWELQLDVSYQNLLPILSTEPAERSKQSQPSLPELIVLVRNLEQLQAALQTGIATIYCEFEDPRIYQHAVQQSRPFKIQNSKFKILVAPPRITKPGENWILEQVRAAAADGYLIRNYDHLQFFADAYCVGDFSFNVANPLTASYLKHQYGLARLTASYDLNAVQLQALIAQCPPEWLEVTIHQHMPMFHMEHCVFCAFLSEGTDYTNCGRPCEQQSVKLRDRVGTEHILHADAGCRNTVFNGTAQTGAEHVKHLLEIGLRHFRIEFVNETPDQVVQTLDRYQQLLQGTITGSQLWRELKLQHQLGVTRGTMERQ